jgi:hypothetical protein
MVAKGDEMNNDLLDKIADVLAVPRFIVGAVAYDESGAPSEIAIVRSCDADRSLLAAEIAALMRAGIHPTDTGWRLLTPAEERDAFCLDAARKTIDEVRRLVKAGPLEATTEAVARALRPTRGEGVAVAIRVPLDDTFCDPANSPR